MFVVGLERGGWVGMRAIIGPAPSTPHLNWPWIGPIQTRCINVPIFCK